MFSEVVLASEQRTRTRRFVAGVSPAFRRRCSTAGISPDPVAIRGEQLVDALNQRAAGRPFAARTSKGPGFKFGCASFLSLLSFRTVPFATADFCKNMPSCIFDVLQKRHFLQKIKLGEIP